MSAKPSKKKTYANRGDRPPQPARPEQQKPQSAAGLVDLAGLDTGLNQGAWANLSFGRLPDVRASETSGGLKAVVGPFRPTQNVLVVGMGDEARGDGGIGLHLVRCLAQMNWPRGVHFRPASEEIVRTAPGYSRVVLLDAIDGPDTPGSLYRADPESLLRASIAGEGSGLGLLGMFPEGLRRRLSIFGVQPRTNGWGSTLSREVIAALPVLLPYLRGVILQLAAETAQMH